MQRRDIVRASVWVTLFAGGLYLAHLMGVVYCPIRRLTGLPCPTCGTIRGTLTLLSGDVHGAFAMQPLGVAAVVGGAVLLLASSVSTGFRRSIVATVRARRCFLIVLGGLALLANWVYVLMTFK